MAGPINIPAAGPPPLGLDPKQNAAVADAVINRMKAEDAAIDRAFRYRTWEIAVKPFVDPEAGKRLLQQILKKRQKAGELTEASILWGQASSFEIVADDLPTFEVRDGNSDPPPPDQVPQQTLVYTEVSRKTHTVRIENPDDSSQWVEVEDTDEVTFSGPDGIYRRFVFKAR